MQPTVALLVTIAVGWSSLQTHVQNYAVAQVAAQQAAATQRVAGASTVQPSGIVSVGGILVSTSIADNLQKMLAAAKADGVSLTGSGYRTMATQIQLRMKGCGPSYYDIYQKPEEACTPPTAIPGTSMHEKGLAIDFWNCATRDAPTYRWLADHAATFGFRNRADEAWHWSTNGQ